MFNNVMSLWNKKRKRIWKAQGKKRKEKPSFPVTAKCKNLGTFRKSVHAPLFVQTTGFGIMSARHLHATMINILIAKHKRRLEYSLWVNKVWQRHIFLLLPHLRVHSLARCSALACFLFLVHSFPLSLSLFLVLDDLSYFIPCLKLIPPLPGLTHNGR